MTTMLVISLFFFIFFVSPVTRNVNSFLTCNLANVSCNAIEHEILDAHKYKNIEKFVFFRSRKETPQKLTQLSSRSHPRHLVGKRTAQKDITIDTTRDSQVNSNFPNRWSAASPTSNNYFYLFLYLYIT